jgi:putative ABC transport system permease protein
MRDRLADIVYRALLLAFPARVRRELGEDMRAMFHEHRRAARGQPFGPMRFWSAAVLDVLFHGFAERLHPAPRTRFSLRTSNFVLERGSVMRAFQHDLKHALRLLVRQPGLTLVAVVTLALGIGANTAIFSAVDAVLLRPLPWPDPDRMVMVWEKRPQEGVMDNAVSPADYLDWSRSATSFTAMSAYATVSADLTGRGTPERFVAGAVSASFFDVFGAKPIAGRVFTRDEEIVGRHRVVVLSYPLWTERFGSDRSVLGRKVVLNGIPHEVVGVVGPFEFVDKEARLWTPLALEGGAEPPSRAMHALDVYGRLKPAVSVERARAEMHAIGERLSREYPETNRRHGSHVVPLRGELVAPVRSGLLLLLAAVGFVLLIACVNVANLLLARAVSRRREIAVRAALGAGRARLALQGLTESLVLAFAGGLAGLLVARWSLDALPHLMPEAQTVVGLDRLGIDARVIGFAALLTFATGVLFGLLPAWHLARQEVNQGLRDGGRSIAGGRRTLRAGLVVTEVALASLLLVGAGLALRSFRTILAADPGMRSNGVMTALVTLPNARYPELERRVATFDAIEACLAAIPGVRSTGATSLLPMSGMNARRGIAIQGRDATNDAPTRAHPRGVTPGYFQTLGIRIVRGRGFTPQDDNRAPLVAVINEEAARRFWPGASPIGAKLRLNGEEEDWREIVGVVGDVRHWGLAGPVEPELYMPIRQRQYRWDGMVFIASASRDPESLAPDIRSAVRVVDPDLVVSRLRTMADVEAASVQPQRVTMLLLAAFGGTALLLAAAGIYGVMAHLVSLRTAEIGIRMTLGARPRDVLRQILGEAVAQAAAGLAIGLAGAIVLTRWFRAMLYEVSPTDPATLVGVALVLLASAILACYVPARRAMNVDPVSALRAE